MRYLLSGERSPIALNEPCIAPEARDLVLEVLASGRLSLGPMESELERLWAATHCVEHAVAVASGTVALTAALAALRIGPDDEIITTPWSFNATLNTILHAGATARFADVTRDYTIDPASVAQLITDRTRAILPVHLFGLPADMPALAAIASEHGLAILEDAAQAVGAGIAGSSVGSFGLGAFSLSALKNVTAGEGGMVTTDDAGHAERIRALRNQGRVTPGDFVCIGHNWRLSELAAALGLAQLRRLDHLRARRRVNAATLSAELDGVAGLILPCAPEGRRHAWHRYVVAVHPEARLARDGLARHLAAHGIATGIHYPRLMPDYSCYRGHPGVGLDRTPVARALQPQVLSLPVHPELTEIDLDRIIAAVRSGLE